MEYFKILITDLSHIHALNPFQNCVLKMLLGYIVYSLAESTFDGTTCFLTGDVEGKFDVWV